MAGGVSPTMTMITTNGSCVHGVNLMALCGQCPLGHKIISLRADGSTVAVDRQCELEHSLATTFITLQREKNPAERTRMWSECLRLAAEIEKTQ